MNALFDPVREGAVALDVMAVSRSNRDMVEARQRARLDHLLTQARCSSRLYRERLPAERNGPVGLAAMPVVTRAELMARFDDWVTDPELRLDALRAFVADTSRIGEPYLGRYLVWESSGTSGQPGIFVQDAHSMAVYDALEALRRRVPRHLLRLLDPLYLGERIAFIGATGGHFASYVSMQRMCELNPWMALAVRCFSILEPTDALVAGLNEFAPTVIATYPTAAVLLAGEAERGKLHVRLHEIWTGGETLSPTVRQHVEQVLDCSVRNNYGASEFLAIGWECAEGCLHANADWVILEPVDARHRPVPEGEFGNSVLLTHLGNFVQPLIRYDLGDQLRFVPGACACGSPLPVIEVQGRRDDPLVMAGAQGHPVTLLPLALTTVLEEQAGVYDFQVRQCDDHTLVLRLSQQGEAGMAAMARCRGALQSFAQVQGLRPIRVVEELGCPVPRGRSGKTRRILARDA